MRQHQHQHQQHGSNHVHAHVNPIYGPGVRVSVSSRPQGFFSWICSKISSFFSCCFGMFGSSRSSAQVTHYPPVTGVVGPAYNTHTTVHPISGGYQPTNAHYGPLFPAHRSNVHPIIEPSNVHPIGGRAPHAHVVASHRSHPRM